MVEIDIHKYAQRYVSKDKYVMAIVTPEEALEIIVSLSNQLMKRSPNSSRSEQPCHIRGDIDAGGLFSISVMSMDEREAIKTLLEAHNAEG